MSYRKYVELVIDEENRYFYGIDFEKTITRAFFFPKENKVTSIVQNRKSGEVWIETPPMCNKGYVVGCPFAFCGRCLHQGINCVGLKYSGNNELVRIRAKSIDEQSETD